MKKLSLLMMFHTLHIFFLILVINKRSTGGKIGSTNEYECVPTADFAIRTLLELAGQNVGLGDGVDTPKLIRLL